MLFIKSHTLIAWSPSSVTFCMHIFHVYGVVPLEVLAFIGLICCSFLGGVILAKSSATDGT